MRSNTWALLGALLALSAAALVAGCGGSDEGASSAATAAGNPTDRAFVADMIPHHRSAVEMAAVAESEATSQFVKDLAADITRSQNEEIGQMQRVDAQLAKAGVEKGDLGMEDHAKGMDSSAQELRGAKPFDEKFIAMMLPHHESAVEMARVELAKGENTELKSLAEEIIKEQQREIKEMRAHTGDKTGGAAEMGSEHGSGHSG
ncbi:MAG: DUF305 domain-containing protein [Solirubrobacteraceae bacterium]